MAAVCRVPRASTGMHIGQALAVLPGDPSAHETRRDAEPKPGMSKPISATISRAVMRVA